MVPDSTPQPKKLPKLTSKQQRFVDAYCGEARFNASEAVRLAGYRTKNPNDLGYQLRHTPHVRARIDERLAEIALNASEVLVMLRQDATRRDDEIVDLAREADRAGGKGAGASMVSALVSARSAATQQLAKAHGLLTDKYQVDHAGGIAIEIVGVDVDKL